MKILVEKGLNAIVFAMLFIAIAFVLDTSTPANQPEIYDLYESYIQELWFISISFIFLSAVLVLIAIISKFGILVGVSNILKKRYVALGFIINGLGFLCVAYFLSRYVVFPW
jgi:hypothetical protein